MQRRYFLLLPPLFALVTGVAHAGDPPPLVKQEDGKSSNDSGSGAPNDAEAWQPKGPIRREPPPPPPTPAPPPPAATPPPPAEPKPSQSVKTPSKPADAVPAAPKPGPGVPTPPATSDSPTPNVTDVAKKLYMPNQPSVNKLVGTITSLDIDAKLIRVNVEGDVNPQISYDDRTIALQEGIQFPLTELEIGDQVIIRYIGKDFTARAVERTAKAAGSKPAAAASPSTELSTSTASSPAKKVPSHRAKKKRPA